VRDGKLRDLEKIDYALLNIDKIQVEGKRLEKLGIDSDDEMYVDLMAFYISQIGEQFSSSGISEDTLSIFPDLQAIAPEISGMRNIVAHVYHRKDSTLIRSTVVNDIPELKIMLKEVREFLTNNLS